MLTNTVKKVAKPTNCDMEAAASGDRRLLNQAKEKKKEPEKKTMLNEKM